MTNGPDAAFDRARLLGVLGRRRDAIQALEEAVARGYRNYVWFRVQDDLAQLSSEPAFEQLYKKVLGEQK